MTTQRRTDLTPKAPKFTQDQIDWLDSIFPENENIKSTKEELFINLGTRRVVLYLKRLHSEHKRNALV